MRQTGADTLLLAGFSWGKSAIERKQKVPGLIGSTNTHTRTCSFIRQDLSTVQCTVLSNLCTKVITGIENAMKHHK